MPDQNPSDRRRESELPSGWRWTTIGEITLPVEKVKPRERPDDEFIYLDISSINNTSNKITEPKKYVGAEAPSRARQLVHANDVLFSTVRTYLKNIALVPETYDGQIASTGFSVLRCKDGVIPKYLFYYTLSDKFISDLSKLQRGTSYPAVRDSDVHEQIIPLAPFQEQKRIVSKIEKFFSRMDAGVADLKRVQANLARYKASVLKAACDGRLVPAEAELARAEGRDYESGEAILRRNLGERKKKWEEEQKANGNDPSKLKYKEPEPPDTEDLPELPEGWVWAKIDALFDVKYGLSESLSKTEPDHELDVPVLRIPNVTPSGALDLTTLKYFPLDRERRSRLLLYKGDVLFNWRNAPKWIGRSAVIKDSDRFVNASFLLRLRPFGTKYSNFISYYLNYLRITGYFLTRVDNAVNQANFNGSKTKMVDVALPPAAEQERIVAEIERRFSIAKEIECSVDTNLVRAERLRQAILKRAFEGQLVVQNTEDQPASKMLNMANEETQQ